MVTFTGNSAGDTATYTCDPGFELIGVATMTCTLVDANSAVFQPGPPSCRREQYYQGVMYLFGIKEGPDRIKTYCIVFLG